MAGITDENYLVVNQGLNPLVNFNFMLRVEMAFDLPCRRVQAFTRELEYEYIQEGGLNDYVHMRRKPISRPFTLEVERYVGVDYVDPLQLGAELVLPLLLMVSRDPGGWRHGQVSRVYAFTGCTVMKKTFGELVGDSSGLLVETTTIGYRELHVVDLPHTGAREEEQPLVEQESWMKQDTMKDLTVPEIKRQGRETMEQTTPVADRVKDTQLDTEFENLAKELNQALEQLNRDIFDLDKPESGSGTQDGALVAEVKALQQQLEGEGGLEAQKEQQAKLCEEARGKLEAARKKLEEAEAPLREAEQEQTRARAAHEQAANRLRSLQNVEKSLQAQVETLESQLAQASARLTEAEQEKAGAAQADLARAEQALEAAREKQTDLRAALAAQKETAAQRSQERQKAQDAETETVQALQTAEAALKAIPDSRDQAREALAEAQKESDQAEAALSETTARLLDTNKACVRAKKRLDAARKNLRPMQNSSNSLPSRKAQCQDSKTSCGKHYEACTTANKDLQALKDDDSNLTEARTLLRKLQDEARKVRYEDRKLHDAQGYLAQGRKLIAETPTSETGAQS